MYPRNNVQCAKEYFPSTGEYFHKRKASPDGLGYICKTCAIAKTKKHYWDNPERARQQKREYAVTHKEGIAAYHKQYYIDHAEVIRKRVADWVKDNPERKRAMDRLYYEANKDRILAHGKEYALAHPEVGIKAKRDYILRNPERRRKQATDYNQRHPEETKQRATKYRRENPHKARYHRQIRRARIKNVGGMFTPNDILNLFDEQNEQCAYCGIRLIWNIPKDFHVDHIRPISRGGSNNPNNLCLACEFCNLSKADKLLPDWLLTRGW